MANKTSAPTFNDVLALLGGQRFDVAPIPNGAAGSGPRAASGFQVSKYGCAAQIAEAPATAKTTDNRLSPVLILARPGVLLNGEISRILDRGYQKFLKTPHLEIPASADHLRALHRFTEELSEAAGGIMLYNESLGTTSDSYLYDRVKGRPTN